MRTRIVSSSELDPKKGLRASDYVKPRIHIGRMCRPTEGAWKNYCIRTGTLQGGEGNPFARAPAQPVTSVGEVPPFIGYAMLAYLHWWWKESELEVAE